MRQYIFCLNENEFASNLNKLDFSQCDYSHSYIYRYKFFFISYIYIYIYI